MNTKLASIMFGGISLICFPISLIFSTTIIYFIAKSAGIIFGITGGYYGIKSIEKQDKIVGILGINLSVINIAIHLIMF